MKHCMVLDLRCYNVVAALAVRKSHTFDRPVIRLAASRGEKNFIRFGTQCLCGLHACRINCFLRDTGNSVERRGIAKMLREERDHGIHYLWFYRRGCRMVHVAVSYTHLTLPTNREV